MDIKNHDTHTIEGAKKVILKIEKPEEFFYWELKDEKRLWAFELGEVEFLNQYNGWQLISHLHNHYCEEDGDYIGILASSLADAQYYKSLKERFRLEKALITNGFHTVEIGNVDFEKFESH